MPRIVMSAAARCPSCRLARGLAGTAQPPAGAPVPPGPAASNPTGQGGGYVPGPVRQDFSGVQQPAQAPAGDAGQTSQGVPPAQAGPVRVYERPETPPSVVERRRLTWILMGVGLLISLLLLAFGPLRSVLGARNQPAWTPPGKETVGAEAVAILPPGVSAAQATARARYTATSTPSTHRPCRRNEPATGGDPAAGSGGGTARGAHCRGAHAHCRPAGGHRCSAHCRGANGYGSAGLPRRRHRQARQAQLPELTCPAFSRAGRPSRSCPIAAAARRSG